LVVQLCVPQRPARLDDARRAVHIDGGNIATGPGKP
jgi:hypothetical protein